MFALIDCDNFFVSCERIFQPNLKNRPVVVLSNNDGCVVARSYEAKALGIPMAAPFFKIEKQFKAAGGIALSSNYELYADISQRIMSLIRDEFQNLEIYSIIWQAVVLLLRYLMSIALMTIGIFPSVIALQFINITV